MTVKRQIATVFDLNKCLGCQTCTLACKKLWTDDEGQELMYWMNVETCPGSGYPRDWINMGDRRPASEDYGRAWTYNFESRLFRGGARPVSPEPRPDRGANWDEDQGGGDYPNAYYFYLPRSCNHCSNPPCVEACPNDAIYKRDEDGLVIIDQDKCTGRRRCLGACPYKKVFFNPLQRKSEKCIGCFPRIEQGVPFACAATCPGRAQLLGDILDEGSVVHKLVRKWEVALPLKPEAGTEPNAFYVPPLSPSREDEQGREMDEGKIPLEYLEGLFGPGVRSALDTLTAEREKKRQGESSELMDLLIAPTESDLFEI